MPTFTRPPSAVVKRTIEEIISGLLARTDLSISYTINEEGKLAFLEILGITQGQFNNVISRITTDRPDLMT